jgi:hypothetical protein
VHDALGPGTTIAKTQGKRPAAPPPQMRFAAGVTGTDAGTGTGAGAGTGTGTGTGRWALRVPTGHRLSLVWVWVPRG